MTIACVWVEEWEKVCGLSRVTAAWLCVCVCALFGDRRFVAHGLLPQIRASVVTNSAQLTVRTGNFATVASWTGDRQVRVKYLECCVY